GLVISQDEYIFISGGFQTSLYYSDEDSIESVGFEDIFLAKYDLDGANVWFKNIGKGQKRQRPTCLGLDLNGDLLLGGYFADSIQFSDDLTVYTDNSFKDYFIAKLEPTDGLAQWCKPLKSIDTNFSGFIYAITATDNNYYISGVFADSVDIGIDTIVSETKNYYDTHLIKSDKQGNFEWIRLIKGANHDYSYRSSVDADENIYITGYFNSPQLTVDSTESESIVVDQTGTDYDFYIAKYNSLGTLQWIRLNGGKARDRLFRAEIFDNMLNVSGYFADSLYWGGILLTTNGIADQDMFTGSIDFDGNYRNANSFGGTNNSSESGIAVFNTPDALYNVILSNSALLVLGQDIYTSTTGFNYIVMGIVSCLPISIDNTIYTNVQTCYGDSTGSIQIAASGGFEGPWQYSINNGLKYQATQYFPNLPSGSYQVVVIDKEGCSQTGQLVSLTQPGELMIEVISTSDITADADGSIVVGVQGGKSPYTYTLLPNNLMQGFGTFTFGEGDSGIYVVEVNDGQNCGPVASDSIVILDLTYVGMEDFSGIALKIFPNPSTDVVTVEMPLEADEVTMELLNLAGQVVTSRQAFTTGGFLRESLDVSDLAQGMYMLRVNGQTLKSAIVVN
ncbi:MAG: T9SS type A sorting domain-containing protein, partial [Bacteroidales bacterium]